MANSLLAKGSPEWTTIIATNIVISSGMTANLTPIPKISKIKVGPYNDNDSEMGPVVSKQALHRIQSLVSSGVEEGAD